MVQPFPAPVPLHTPAAMIDGLADWHRRYKELKNAEASIAAMIDEARTMLISSVKNTFIDGLPDDVDLTIGGVPVMHLKTVTQRRIDSTRLRREQPELADQYTKISTQERLTII
jgi:hypothetical protein